MRLFACTTLTLFVYNESRGRDLVPRAGGKKQRTARHAGGVREAE